MRQRSINCTTGHGTGFRVTLVARDSSKLGREIGEIKRGTKIVFFQCQGGSVMDRARANADQGAIKRVMNKSHCQFLVDHVDDLTEDEVTRKLSTCMITTAANGGDDALPACRFDLENNTLLLRRGTLRCDETHGTKQPPPAAMTKNNTPEDNNKPEAALLPNGKK
mmetsp:Transcript_7469/g.24666  ORF Transcript_7469/g.24666 Transcript_7469/m.24666 type:complete len:166 (-) Transcript_7469:185-682(-)